MKSLTFLATLAATVSAVPNVVPIPVNYPGTCTSWPGWQRTPDVDVTGAIMFVPASSDDEATNGLPLQLFGVPWQGSTREMLGTDFRASRRFAKAWYRCSNGKVEVGGPGSEQIAIARDSGNAQLLVGAPADTTYTPELYYLEVDGKRLDGVYLGAENQTTWGFIYREAQCGATGVSQKDFQEVKLLNLPIDDANPPTAGYRPEFEGFLKVVTY